MVEKLCSNCNKKLGVLNEKYPLTNQNDQDFIYCAKCYQDITKEEKLKLDPIKKKTGSGLNVGYAFGLVGGLGFASSQKESIMNPIKRHNLTLDEINRYAIMNFNKHFLLCDNNLKAGIMMDMGKKLKKKRLNEIAKQNFISEYDLLERKDQKAVKKELKREWKENMKSNKHLFDLKEFVELELNK